LRPATVQKRNSFNRWSSSDLDARGWLERRADLQLPSHRRITPSPRTMRRPFTCSRNSDRYLEAASVHEAGHREFNMFLWMPPKAADDISAGRFDDLHDVVRRR
jgi:hypothetical protein